VTGCRPPGRSPAPGAWRCHRDKALASLRDPIELADREGLGGLSMRRIATELDLATGISQEQ